MAKRRDVIDPATMQRYMGQAPLRDAMPNVLEYDNTTFGRVNKLSGYTGGVKALEEQRALAQTKGELLGKGLLNLAETVVFGVLGTPGEVASGIGILSGSDSLVDNFYKRAMDSISESVGSLSEVYTPPSLEEGSLGEQIFNPYFFAKEGAEGVGTMLSLMIPGRWVASLGTGAKIGKTLSKLGKLENVAADGTRLLAESPNAFGKFLIKNLGSTGRGIDFGKLGANIDSGLAVAVNTLIEASAESVDAYEGYLKQGLTEQEANAKAHNVFLMNAALLTLSNTLLEKYVFDGFNRLPSTEKLLSAALKGEKLAYQPLKTALKKTAGGIVSEGFMEEGLQTTMTEAATGNLGESALNTINKYFENLSGLVGDDPNIDFGKSVFLGSLLGGGMGGVKGVYETRQQKQLLEGRAAYQPTTRLQKMFNKKAREAEEGLISIYTSNFEKIKQGKEYLKNKEAKDLLEDETALFALSNTFEDFVTQTGGDIKLATAMLSGVLVNDLGISAKDSNALISKLAPENFAGLSKTEALNFIQHRRDTSYFSRFANNPGGFKMLEAHIEDMVDALGTRYEDNTGLKLNDNEKADMKKEMLEKAKSFENTHKAANTFNSNIRYNIKVEPEQKGEFEKFILLNNNVAKEAMNLKMFAEQGFERIETEIAATRNKIEALENTRKNLLAAEDLTKDQKDAIKKEYDTKVKDEMNKIPEYNQKVSDQKAYKEAVDKLTQAIIETSTKDGLEAKWKAFNEQVEPVVTPKYTINKKEVNLEEKSKFHLFLHNEFKSLGYNVSLDPNTGRVVLADNKFFMQVGENLYTVTKETVKTPSGDTVTQFRVIDFETKKESIHDGWSSFVKSFKNIDILSKEEFDSKTSLITLRLEKELTVKRGQAVIKALEELRNELNVNIRAKQKRIATLNKNLQTHTTNLANIDELIKTSPSEALEKLKESRKIVSDVIDKLNTEIANEQAQYELLVGKLRGVNDILANYNGSISERYTEDFFNESIQKLETKGDISQFQNIIEDIKKEAANNFKEAEKIIQEVYKAVQKLTDGINAMVKAREELTNVRDLIDKLVAEGNAGIAVNVDSIPDDIKNKYPGIETILKNIKNTQDITKLLDYFKELSKINSEYVKNLEEFVKDIKPYVSLDASSANSFKPPQKAIDDLTTKIESDNYNRKIYGWLNEYVTYQIFADRLNKKFNVILSRMLKDDLSQQENFTGDPTATIDEFLTASEAEKKVLSVFTTTGRNILQDEDGFDNYRFDSEFNVNVPAVDLDNANFFKWIDQSKGESYSVIPYSPKYTDTDFTDITDEATALAMRNMIMNTPESSRDNALYAVVVHKEGGVYKVKMFEGKPVFTSIMKPDTRYPQGKESKVAGRINVEYFLNDIIFNGTLKIEPREGYTKPVTFTNAQVDKLKSYGIEIVGPTSYEALEPYARMYAREKYIIGVQNKIDQASKDYISLEERIKSSAFEVNLDNPISGGFLVTAKDSQGNRVKIKTDNLGLEYTDSWAPKNFSIIQADWQGKYNTSFKTYTGLIPGMAYIELDNQDNLIPFDPGYLSEKEIDVILFLISQYSGEERSLSKKLPYLKNYIMLKGTKKNLSDLNIIPTNTEKNSLMNFFMHWGFQKDNLDNPYNIYIAKGRLKFGSMSMSLDELKEAYDNNDTAKLEPLVEFLKTKKHNISFNLLNSNVSTVLDFEVKKRSNGQKYISSSVSKGNYTHRLMKRSSIYGTSKELRDKHQLPVFSQKYFKFKDFSKPTDEQKLEIQEKIKTSIAAAKANKGKASSPGTSTAAPEFAPAVQKAINDLMTAIKSNDIETIKLKVAQLSTANPSQEVKDVLKGIRGLLDLNAPASEYQSYANRLQSVLDNKNTPVKIDYDKFRSELVKKHVALSKYINQQEYDMFVDIVGKEDFEIFHETLWPRLTDKEVLEEVFKAGFYPKPALISRDGSKILQSTEIVNLNETDLQKVINETEANVNQVRSSLGEGLLNMLEQEVRRLKLVLETLKNNETAIPEEPPVAEPEVEPETVEEEVVTLDSGITSNGTTFKLGDVYKSSKNEFTIIAILPDRVYFKNTQGEEKDYVYGAFQRFLTNGANGGWVKVEPEIESEPEVEVKSVALEVGDFITVVEEDETYTIVDMDSSIVRLNSGLALDYMEFLEAIKDGRFIYKPKGVEKRYVTLDILNKAIEKGIVETINCK